MNESLKTALRIGMASVKASRWPAVLLWAFAFCLAFFYLTFPCVAQSLDPVRKWQKEWGWMAAALTAGGFCGLLPGVLQLVFHSIRPRRLVRTVFAQTALSCFNGILCYWFYCQQANWFGISTDVLTLVTKMFVDQFLWTPLTIAPLNAVVFFWAARDFSFDRVRREWPRPWLARLLLPYLVSAWCVNVIPNLALYAFPPALQILMAGILCSFWTLMCLQVAARSR